METTKDPRAALTAGGVTEGMSFDMTKNSRQCLDCERTDLWGRWCCQPHYRERLRNGTLPKRPTTEERFWGHVRKTDGCWFWCSTERKGYGRFTVTTANAVSAHRFAYELAHGPIADGMTIDHLCNQTLCVNPAHMEPVTLLENIARRDLRKSGKLTVL